MTKQEKKTQSKAPNKKTLHNTTASQAKNNVSDIIFWGNGDTFKLISKASSKKEGWMKSTKAMAIPGAGVVVQVTTQQGDNVAEALTFVPGACIVEYLDHLHNVTNRKIVHRGSFSSGECLSEKIKPIKAPKGQWFKVDFKGTKRPVKILSGSKKKATKEKRTRDNSF
jgi:hypothetical protein